MNTPTKHQIIEQDGRPLFVVVPYDDYLELTGEAAPTATIPHEVVRRTVLEGISLMRAWREHKGLTQTTVAEAMGVSQAAYAAMERPDARPRHVTLQKVARAMGLVTEQLQPADE
ncbi:helix-turn-helix domain-containing protein [Desulfolutivibrio sp.]|uniref:helix-turn-helix domain-containing protein n=1 Tax=Desulfolutivibrio sp. TaxID=2773296 RepID=UPI002F969192